MNRIFEMMVDYNTSTKFEVFRDISSAKKWIDKKGIDTVKVLDEIKK